MASQFGCATPQRVMLPVTLVEAEPNTSQTKSKWDGLPDVATIAHATLARQSIIEIQIAGATVRFDERADLTTVRALVRMLRA